MLVFRDISERKQHEQAIQGALDYAQNILRTLHEPFLVLDKDLRIVTTSDAFCQTFKVDSQHIQGQLIFELGNGQWNIPKLRDLLINILPENHTFDEFEVEHDFPSIGKRIMLLNARRIKKPGDNSELILLAIKDATERLLLARKLHISEQRYRRLFESARDGILILDAGSMTVIDANPFMTELLGYTASEFQGKHLWEIGLFKDKTQSLAAVQQLKDIGLALAKNLIEMHHGTLVAQSDGLEKGSTFTMKLPLSQTAGSDLEPDVPIEDDSKNNALRVLVVDDNMDGAKMSVMLLQAWGHKTRFAYDGKTALELAQRFAPQVILLDLGLPDMDGYEVARRIRKDPALKQIQLIAITGYGQQSDRQRTIEAGFDAHMVKPVEHDVLRKMLADIKPVSN